MSMNLLIMLFLLFHLTIIILVESRGEKYDLETFNIMQILRPVGILLFLLLNNIIYYIDKINYFL